MKTTKPKNVLQRYTTALSVFDSTLKYLKNIHHPDNELLKDLDKIIFHLKGMSIAETYEILGEHPSKGTSKTSSNRERNRLDISNLSIDEIKDIVNNTQTTRLEMAEIATIRFGVSSGSVASLKNKNMLKDKLLNLIENERTHSVIVDVVEENNTASMKKITD
ncbi:hypothetical protein NG896_12560 [Aeromonas veronii]|uniref:hypothetical protein n=1 Tax=Aeromonas veronii TaxID=654 RepID=UPI002091B06C|nr:hypothetical protein [Aeromonas veronii]MCO5343406.1 hypothetical protein [Aeromonas veronii]